MREQILENIINLLQRLNYFEVVTDQVRFEKFIQGLSIEQFKNLLLTFNAKLRNVPISEKGFQKEGFMLVGDWCSPPKDVQDRMLEKLLDGLKQLNDNKDRATLTYYMLLDLHMFDDGNGRTARFFYDLILGNIDLMENIDWYIHDDNNNSLYETTFEETIGIADIRDVNYYIGLTMEHDLENNGISREIEMHGIRFFQGCNGVFISDEIKTQLTKNEICSLNSLLLDKHGRYTTDGIIAMIIATKKVQFKQRINSDDDQNKLLEFYPEMFDNWTIEDYRGLIKVASEIKEKQLEHMINIFVKPDKYVFEDGVTYKQTIYDADVDENTL